MRYATIPLYNKRVYYVLVICEVSLAWVTFCALIQAVNPLFNNKSMDLYSF